MKKTLAATLFLTLVTFGYSQTVVAEFDLQGGQINGIQAFSLYDSTLVCFSHRDVKRSFWISKDGNKNEVTMAIRPDAPIVGVTGRADYAVYYYYLNDMNGQLVLQALEQARGTEELKFARPIFPIPGALLGLHVGRDIVTMVSYVKKPNQLRILTLDGLQILHENVFDMPFDISRHIRSNSGFIVGTEMIGFNQADKKFKLYREGNDVVITIDQDLPGLENKKTTLIRMDVVTGAQQVYTLQRDDYDQFASFYFENYVYQMSHAPKKYIRCDAVDLKSGKRIFIKMFEKNKAMQDQKVIVHRGKSVQAGYSTLYEMITVSETPVPSMIVHRTADSTRLRLLLGAVHYYEEPIFIPIPLPMLDPAVLISLTIMPVNSNVRYLTITGNTENGFDMDPVENNPAPTIRQRIDEYEISKTSGKAKDEPGWDLLFKGYAEQNDGVVGIYSLKGRKIMLVKYHNR